MQVPIRVHRGGPPPVPALAAAAPPRRAGRRRHRQRAVRARGRHGQHPDLRGGAQRPELGATRRLRPGSAG